MRKIELDELKQLQLQILDEVVDFCNQHQIKYFLMAGTLLGAVRHQGYIPWDDDIDIGMLREDYERFLNLYTKKQNSNYYLYNIHQDKKCSLFFTKICLKNTIEIDNNLVISEQYGLNIDLFPIDDLTSSNTIIITKYLHLLFKLRNIKAIKISEYRKKGYLKLIFVLIIKLITYPISYLFLYKLIMKKINYEKQNNKPIQKRGNLVWGYGVLELVDPLIFDDMIDILFEGKKYTCPKQYHNWLTNIYGNYMILPPVENRIQHNRKVYKI